MSSGVPRKIKSTKNINHHISTMKSFHFAITITLLLPVVSSFLLSIKKDTIRCPTRETSLYYTSLQAAPLNQQEIEQILEGVPVYALTSKENDSVLLVEENDKNVANFFLSKEFADTLASGHDDSLRVDGFSLGKVYFSMFGSDSSSNSNRIDNDIKIITSNDLDVEYRLIPDSREVDQARSILSQLSGVDAFSTAFEIPLFMDQHLRLTTGSEEDGDYQEIFPIYFGWNDLVKTCQEYVRAFAEEGEEYEAAISVSELNQLVEQMKQPSPEDFRNVQFVPASPRPLDT